MARIRRKARSRKVRAPRNSLERDTQIVLKDSFKSEVDYEPDKIKYVIPESHHIYTPDFKVRNKKIYIETKGKWTRQDRKKMLLVIQQHPDKKFYMYFQSGNKPINRGSKTSYGDWCDKNGIEWSDKSRGVPDKWLR
jgi:predicted nuclease of restriction endonuclease-like RecB superfamily